MIKAWSRLPSEYQEVDYIESSGNQHINTGVPMSDIIQLDGEFAFTSINNVQGFFGRFTATSTTIQGILNSSSNVINFRWLSVNSTIALDTNKHSFSMSNKQTSIDGIVKNTYNLGKASDNDTLLLMARRADNGGPGIQNNGSLKLYGFRIYTDSGQVRKFIPCYRKSDNEVGLYDLVNNQFYTNQGGGTFKKGENILAIKTIKLYKDNSTNEIKYIKTRSNNLLNFFYSNSLPYTTKGIIFDEISEGIVNVTGEKTDSGYATLYIGWDKVTLKAGKTYAMGQNLTITCYKAADSSWYGNVSNVITPAEDLVTRDGYIATNSTTPNYDAYVMLIEGNTKPNYYVPYMAKVFDQLPSEYQRVEYIGANGTQYINLGKIYTGKEFGIEMDFSINQLQAFQNLWCCRTNGTNNTRTCFVTQNTGFRNDQQGQANLSLTLELNTRYNVKSLSNSFSLNDTILRNYNKEYNSSGINDDFWLIGAHPDSGVATLTYPFYGSLYKCKIYNGNETIMNLVPCYKKSNNEIGMYDLISNTFYTNGGTGTFIKGNDI